MAQKKMTKDQIEQFKGTLMTEMSRHVGKSNAIGMGELYHRVFGESWNNRINDTRRLRSVVTALRKDGVPILSNSSSTGGGYYLAGARSEIDAYCSHIRKRALGMLAREAKLRKMSLPELVGQVQMTLVS